MAHLVVFVPKPLDMVPLAGPVADAVAGCSSPSFSKNASKCSKSFSGINGRIPDQQQNVMITPKDIIPLQRQLLRRRKRTIDMFLHALTSLVHWLPL